MKLSSFDYDLPEELIAHQPTPNRDSSRLLVCPRHIDHSLHDVVYSLRHEPFSALPDYLQDGDLLIMNDTRVIPARVFATKSSGGQVELLFLQQTPENLSHWNVIARSSRPLKPKMSLSLPFNRDIEVLESLGGGMWKVNVFQEHGFIGFLEEIGELPLPPYIDREKAKDLHSERYQTIYAKVPGAVAAPTAGLHFTSRIVEQIRQKGVRLAWVTLHVGPGTFLPVRTDEIADHKMHSEWYQIPTETAQLHEQTRADGGRVIAVGTTSLRALEASTSSHGKVLAQQAQTDIFLYPGHNILSADGLLTNFHLPKSTLLMLVSAFSSRETILSAYQEAIQQKYRFFSYGDAMLLI